MILHRSTKNRNYKIRNLTSFSNPRFWTHATTSLIQGGNRKICITAQNKRKNCEKNVFDFSEPRTAEYDIVYTRLCK
jgi:hypothetical protein